MLTGFTCLTSGDDYSALALDTYTWLAHGLCRIDKAQGVILSSKQRTGIADPDQSYLFLSNERRYNRIPAPLRIAIRAGTFWQMV